MTQPRPFRFGAECGHASSAKEWAEKARRAEDLGFSTFLVPDHLDDRFAPVPALAVAAAVTTTLRIGSLVFGVDYRHPAFLAKEAATLDLLSDGRLEVGLGAGWASADYAATGIRLDPPAARIERLEETIAILKGTLTGRTFSFTGRHYTINELEILPRPVQQPRPPLLVGGGSPRVLRLAAREADVVSVNFRLNTGAIDGVTMGTGGEAATVEKVAWVRDAAGDRMDSIELSNNVYVAKVTSDRRGAAARAATMFGISAEDALDSPHLLVGSVDQMVDELRRRREVFGFSYVIFASDTFEQVGDLVGRLAGS